MTVIVSNTKNVVVTTLYWHFSLYKKVLSLTIGNTIHAVVLSVLSKVFYLLSFLLPLKAILLAGRPLPPELIAQHYPSVTTNDLVLGLSAITVIFYLGNLSLQRLIRVRVDSGAKKIAAKTQKIGANLNVLDETERSYEVVIKSLTSLIFYFIVSVALISIYPKIFVVFSIVVMVPWLLVILIGYYPENIFNRWLSVNRVILQQRWMFFVFIFSFSVIVFDIVREDVELSILIALISFILCRYALTAANEFINAGFKLYLLRDKMSNLFFFSPPKAYSQLTEIKLVNSLLNVDDIWRLAKVMLQHSGVSSKKIKSIAWRPMGVFGVYCFDLYIEGNKSCAPINCDRLVFKIYQKKYEFMTRHEKLLLESFSSSVASIPNLMFNDVIEDFHCSLFQWPGASINTITAYELGVVETLIDTWSLEVTAKIFSAYSRSHKCGIEKLERFQIDSLSLACNDESEILCVKELASSIDEIKKYVLALPKALHNPEITMNVMSVNSENRNMILQWGRWSLEPVGTAFWYFDFVDNDALDRIVGNLVEARKDCSGLVPDQLRLSGQLYKLWRLIGRQKLPDALSTVKNVLEIYKKLDPAMADSKLRQ